MNKPIIDPSQLTEEQKRIIRKRFFLSIELASQKPQFALSAHMVTDEYKWLFGEDMFKTKENK